MGPGGPKTCHQNQKVQRLFFCFFFGFANVSKAMGQIGNFYVVVCFMFKPKIFDLRENIILLEKYSFSIFIVKFSHRRFAPPARSKYFPRDINFTLLADSRRFEKKNVFLNLRLSIFLTGKACQNQSESKCFY